jgi:hypothetical protein
MPRRVDDRVRLLHGPYRGRRLRVGDRASCLFRDCDIVETGWTDAPISWPRGVLVGKRSGPSRLVDEVLASAIQQDIGLKMQCQSSVPSAFRDRPEVSAG